ncbi:hypothetical protein ABEB36_008345 [Hypothenemus hampei]|uniref:Uncharacterized protein n=1 Tax=Hypothenemus hampei TaxID=57062 RepID=A0ABD1ELH6_HYPHA
MSDITEVFCEYAMEHISNLPVMHANYRRIETDFVSEDHVGMIKKVESFFQSKFDYLGEGIGQNKERQKDLKIKALIKQIRQFLGLAGCFCKFIYDVELKAKGRIRGSEPETNAAAITYDFRSKKFNGVIY